MTLFSRISIISAFAVLFLSGTAFAAGGGTHMAEAELPSHNKPPAMDNARLAIIAKTEEKTLRARIGIAVLDEAGSVKAAWRGEERFPLNSTHKAFLCGALLYKAERGAFSMSDKIQFGKDKLVSHSPVTVNFTAPVTMDWRQICGAAISYSDNTAANLLSEKLGGPAGLNAFLRNIGDNITRLDRFEPELNSSIPGDKRDTTTPVAVSQSLQKLLLGDVLSPESRQELTQWLIDDKVADALLRSVLPPQWKIADKTGAGDYGSRSIVSVVWRQKAKPLVIAVYITQTSANITQSNASVARIGKAIFSAAEQERN